MVSTRVCQQVALIQLTTKISLRASPMYVKPRSTQLAATSGMGRVQTWDVAQEIPHRHQSCGGNRELRIAQIAAALPTFPSRLSWILELCKNVRRMSKDFIYFGGSASSLRSIALLRQGLRDRLPVDMHCEWTRVLAVSSRISQQRRWQGCPILKRVENHKIRPIKSPRPPIHPAPPLQRHPWQQSS